MIVYLTLQLSWNIGVLVGLPKKDWCSLELAPSLYAVLLPCQPDGRELDQDKQTPEGLDLSLPGGPEASETQSESHGLFMGCLVPGV